MKIVSLKALNINSLKGKTEINFEELTKESALFAITGATGSGKSTILDIISCALYGQTARLKRPPNDLMSRHTGEAFCEVDFEIKGRLYRSSWRQKRARKKPDGAFQTAKMELTDLDEGKILPLKSSEVPKKIEELSGLDFSRFTQSMLLAQGGFDAFLKADEKERSALLEKITQTQVYAEISKAVFEKHRTYQQEIDIEQKMLESIEFLELEVVEQKQKQLSQKIAQKRESDEELKKLTQALNYLKKSSELRADSQKYEAEFLESSRVKEEHKSSFEKLALANRALTISATFTSFSQLQESVSSDKLKSQKEGEELLTLDSEIQMKAKEYSAFKGEFETQSEVFKTQNESLKKAREIQTQERETKLNLKSIESSLHKKVDELAEVKKSLNTITQNYDSVEKEVALKKSYLATNSKDERLLSVMGVVEQSINEYKKERESFSQNRSSLESLKSRVLTEESNYTLKKEEVERLSEAFREVQEAYKTLEKKSLDDFNVEESVKESLDETQSLHKAVDRYTQVVQERDKELAEFEKNSEFVSSLEESKKLSMETIALLKKHIATLREKQEKEQLLKKYEEDRVSLVEGEECSLCGSLTHPFAKSSFEVHIDKTKEQIVSEVNELESQEKALKELELRLGVKQTKKESSLLEIKKLEQEMESLTHLFEQHSFKVNTHTARELKEREEELTQKLEVIKQNRLKKEELLKRRDSASGEFQEKREALSEIKSAIERVHLKEEQLVVALKSNESKMSELSSTLASHFESFGLKLDVENIDREYKELQKREELYTATQKALKLLEIELNRYTVDKKESEREVTSLTKEIDAFQRDIKEIQCKLKELASKRVEVLNVVELDLYEKEIVTVYEKAQEREQLSKNELDKLKVKSQERVASKKSLDDDIAKNEKKLESLKVELEELYKQNNFKESREFQNAMLKTKEREELTLFCKRIEDSYNQTQTLKTQAQERLKEHEKIAQSDKSVEELEILLSLLGQKVDALQESIGSDKKELELNQENSDKFQKKIASLKKKKESFSVWIKLNELVGSADGAKFKKFAQGITLDQLINLANQHLRLLSPRYILSRNQEKLLELEIVDAYQGDVVRPVTTLSGGESFIVSLALALGLSELASQKIAIDSLFLDEGFGTLDEESLETALNALNLLQSSGKMVGVISHVEALKERIPLQIKVIARGDGSSYVEI